MNYSVLIFVILVAVVRNSYAEMGVRSYTNNPYRSGQNSNEANQKYILLNNDYMANGRVSNAASRLNSRAKFLIAPSVGAMNNNHLFQNGFFNSLGPNKGINHGANYRLTSYPGFQVLNSGGNLLPVSRLNSNTGPLPFMSIGGNYLGNRYTGRVVGLGSRALDNNNNGVNQAGTDQSYVLVTDDAKTSEPALGSRSIGSASVVPSYVVVTDGRDNIVAQRSFSEGDLVYVVADSANGNAANVYGPGAGSRSFGNSDARMDTANVYTVESNTGYADEADATVNPDSLNTGARSLGNTAVNAYELGSRNSNGLNNVYVSGPRYTSGYGQSEGARSYRNYASNLYGSGADGHTYNSRNANAQTVGARSNDNLVSGSYGSAAGIAGIIGLNYGNVPEGGYAYGPAVGSRSYENSATSLFAPKAENSNGLYNNNAYGLRNAYGYIPTAGSRSYRNSASNSFAPGVGYLNRLNYGYFPDSLYGYSPAAGSRTFGNKVSTSFSLGAGNLDNYNAHGAGNAYDVPVGARSYGNLASKSFRPETGENGLVTDNAFETGYESGYRPSAGARNYMNGNSNLFGIEADNSNAAGHTKTRSAGARSYGNSGSSLYLQGPETSNAYVLGNSNGHDSATGARSYVNSPSDKNANKFSDSAANSNGNEHGAQSAAGSVAGANIDNNDTK